MLDLKRPMNVLCITHSNQSIQEQIKETWLSFIQREISMSTNLVILGRPPGRALFNVKSRTLRVLTTMVSSPWQFHSLFFSLFFTWNKKQELTPFSNQDNEKNFYLGYSHTSPTLGVCIAGQQNFKCVEFKSPSIVILSIKCTKAL